MAQKYVVVHFFDRYDVGYNFPRTSWMPHVTLLPLFTTADIDLVTRQMEKLAKMTKPFRMKVVGSADFGPKKDIPVMLLDTPYSIISLHASLSAIPSVKIDTPKYSGVGYKPHITVQENSDIKVGQQFEINGLTLVDMYPDGDMERRQIMANLPLGGSDGR